MKKHMIWLLAFAPLTVQASTAPEATSAEAAVAEAGMEEAASADMASYGSLTGASASAKGAKSGAFGGVALGMAFGTGSFNEKGFIAAVEENKQDLKFNKAAFAGGVFAGYQYLINQFYIAGELIGVYRSYSQKFEGKDTVAGGEKHPTFTYKQNLAGGAAVRLGYVVKSKIVPYLKGGVELAGWEVKGENFRDQTVDKKNGVSVAPVVGGGVSYFMNAKMSVGIEYQSAFHQKKKIELGSDKHDNYKIEFNPHVGQATLRFTYHI